MAKIETYVLATSPLSFSDMLIGTEVNGPIPNATKNFSLQELYGLFATIPITGNLQQVLDTGNTATQNIILTGDITSTTITPEYIVDMLASTGAVGEVLMRAVGGMSWAPLTTPNLQSVLNSGSTATSNMSLVGNLTVTKAIPGNIEDAVGNTGTTGQVLYKSGSGLLWANLPTVTTPGLQDVLNVGWVATANIILTGTIDVTNIEPYSITDELNSTGTIGQVLSRSSTGIRWDNIGGVNSVTATSPLASSGGSTPNITIQQANISQSGYLSSGDWTIFNSKQPQLNGTGFVKASGTTITYDNSTYLTTGAAASTYVPYTGATGNVNLGTNNLRATKLQVPDSLFGDWSIFTKTVGGWEFLKIEDSKNFERILISGEPSAVSLDNSISVVTSLNISKLLFPTSASTTLTFPIGTGYLPLNVNGYTADANGAITIPLGTGNVSGTGVSTRIAFWDSSSSISSDSDLYWDNTNKSLGIGTSSPDTKLHIKSSTVPLASIKVEATNGLPVIGTITAYPAGQISGTLRIDSDGHIRLASSSSKYEIASTGNHFFGDGFTGYLTNNKFWFKGGSMYVEDRISAVTLGVGFNNNVNASAALEIQSTSKGFLLPRMNTTQRDAISSPAIGLTIYNTVTSKYNYYDGSSWIEMAISTASQSVGFEQNFLLMGA